MRARLRKLRPSNPGADQQHQRHAQFRPPPARAAIAPRRGCRSAGGRRTSAPPADAMPAAPNAGAIPNTSPVSSVNAKVNARTRRSIAIAGYRSSTSGFHAFNPPTASNASSDARHAARHREHQALHERLPDHLPAAAPSASRTASSRLPRRRPRQQQIGQVRAGDQQHQPHRAAQHQQRRPQISGDAPLQRRRLDAHPVEESGALEFLWVLGANRRRQIAVTVPATARR